MNHTVQLACRHCQAANRVPIDRALVDLAAVVCGRCGQRMLRVQGEALSDLRDDELAHPWDREALSTLRALPMADKLLSKVMGATVDKIGRFRYLAGAVRVRPDHISGLWKLYAEAAQRLCVDPPPLFIMQSPQINAVAVGAGAPFVGVTSGLIDALGERQIVSVLGHELTHVRLGHVLYRTLAVLLAQGGVGLLDRFLGIGALLATPLRLSLLRWYQMSELSADRGGLLAVGSLRDHLLAEMWLAGGSTRYGGEMDTEAFLAQAAEAEAMRDSDLLLYAMEMLDSTQRTHPMPVWRAHHADRWAHSEPFFRILAGENRPLLEVSDPS